MPVAVAAIPAVAGLVGSAIAAHQQGKANKAASASQAEALAYEKQKDAEAKARYDEAKQRYDFAQQQAWKMKQGVLSRYGIHLPDLPQFQAQQAPQLGSMVPPVHLGTLAQAPPPPGPGMAPPMAPGGAPAFQHVPTMGADQGQDPTDWADWRRYAAVS